ncbi:MAG: hypothetical protein AAF802_14815 [Planctomycetota bacterium]
MLCFTTSRPLTQAERWTREIPGLLQIVSLALLTSFTHSVSAQVRLDTLRQSDDFVQRLVEPHSGLIDGTEFRKAIEMVASPGSPRGEMINFWVDRKVNPNAPVSPGALGPTRFASLAKIAEELDCLCFPTENCVLIGRPVWVGKILESLSTQPGSTGSNSAAGILPQKPVDVRWQMLSTPTEARNAVFDAAFAADPTIRQRLDSPLLPHDLWPQHAWSKISPKTALRLIEGQFHSVAASGETGSATGRAKSHHTRAYQFAGVTDLVDQEPSESAIKAERAGKLLRIDANVGVHARLCRQLLSRRPGGDHGEESNAGLANRLRNDPRTFTLTVKNQPARDVLRALASQMNVDCEFADANPAFDRRVSFEAVDQTLWDLVRLIAEQASLKIRVGDGKLQVSADASRER